ncbi:MAG: class D beta-lactamase [Thermoflexales bacterium]|nr:class D beta-lactamase [Thermoflexales bacterium]
MTRRLAFITAFVLWTTLVVGCRGPQAQPVPTPTPTQLSAAPAAGPVSELRPELERHFPKAKGAFVLYDLNDKRYSRYNPERCATSFLPASTFKIMNSLAGLEAGVIPDENHVIPWDGTRYAIEAWNRDHTLKTAIQNSVVWYYQELARQVGKEKMQAYLEEAGYGNKDVSGQIDTFWLEGGVRISADEQVEFLKRLYQGELPFSTRSVAVVKDILVLEEGDAYRFSGKTGSAQRVQPHTGWFVGYLEREGNVYFFATNFESTDPNGLANGETAKKITRSILRDMGLLP